MTDATLQDIDSAPAAKSRAATRYRRFCVDLWATSLNDVEIGIMRQTQHRAKSSQFTKDMDVIGQITEDGKRTGIVAYREGVWNDEKGAKRRLIIKLFTDSMNWRGTMDMMVGRSLQLTHGADGIPVTAYSVNVARHEQIIQIERSADQWWFFPEKFSFFILDDDGPRYYKLRQNLISIGADYSIYDQRDRKIGRLDGKLFSLGGRWNVRIKEEHEDQKLDATLKLFCTMLRFNKRARRHIGKLSREMRLGRAELGLDTYEQDLYMNPRRAR